MKKLLTLFFVLFIFCACDTECNGLRDFIVKKNSDGVYVGFAKSWEDIERCLVDYRSLSGINCYIFPSLNSQRDSLAWEDFDSSDLENSISFMKKNFFHYMFFVRREEGSTTKEFYLLEYKNNKLKRTILYYE